MSRAKLTLQVTEVWVIAITVVVLNFILQGHLGLNLWDEGFLWYGAQRVLLGEVPIRDFMSYDPGRYYWSAAYMRLIEDQGIITLRLAVAMFQVLGLAAAMVMIAEAIKNNSFISRVGYLILCSCVIIIWMYPRHKIFDLSISIILVWCLSHLIRNPTRICCLLVGLLAGFTSFFGRNHFLYAAIGISIALVLLSRKYAWRQWFQINGNLTIGVIVGFMPIVLMCMFVPDFGKAYWEGIWWLIVNRQTNLELPVPWPWKVDIANLAPIDMVSEVLVGILFVSLIIYACGVLIYLAKASWRGQFVDPTIAATGCLALPYVHYAFSRADLGHLAHAIFPMLIGCFVFTAKCRPVIKWTLASCICAVTLLTVGTYQPGYEYAINSDWKQVAIGKDELIIDVETRKQVDLVEKCVETYAPNGKSFMVAPYWPGAYALTAGKSPMWEIYALWPRPLKAQQAEIERIKMAEPQFLLINNAPLDGRDERRFSVTHYAISEFIKNKYTLTWQSDDGMYSLFVPR